MRSIKDKLQDMIRYAQNDPQARGLVLHRHAVMARIGLPPEREYNRRSPAAKGAVEEIDEAIQREIDDEDN